MSDTAAFKFASLPSIDQLLNSVSAADLISRFGRSEIKRVAQITLDGMRIRLKRGEPVDSEEQARMVARYSSRSRCNRASDLKPSGACDEIQDYTRDGWTAESAEAGSYQDPDDTHVDARSLGQRGEKPAHGSAYDNHREEAD
jgi:hypothetical protein